MALGNVRCLPAWYHDTTGGVVLVRQSITMAAMSTVCAAAAPWASSACLRRCVRVPCSPAPARLLQPAPRRPLRCPSRPSLLPRHGARICMAMGGNNNSSSQPSPPPAQVYRGVYGPWSVDSVDVREVVLYRAGLVTAVTTFIAAASTALLPDDNSVKSLLQSLYDPLYVVGAGGLGSSLFLIHIYVTPIKRTLQVLWAVGVLGSLGIAVNFAAPVDQGLVEFVLNNPPAIWAVGPLFASLTGLVFKEGLCYGKLEAAVLFFVIPSLLLGRLSGLLDERIQLGLLVAWMALFALFASRKFTQPIKDDIGDKSVFMFKALPEDAQQALLQRLQEQQAAQQDITG